LSATASATRGQTAPAYVEHDDLTYLLTHNGPRRPITQRNDWEERRAHILAAVQQVMGPLPRPARPVSLDMQILEETDLGDSLRRKVAYHTDSADAQVRAWMFLPKPNAGQPRPAVLCLHQTTPIGKDEPAGMGPKPNLHYALELAQRGYVALAPDYPSFGEYEYDFDADA
jgi:hypothetical protein